MAMEKQLCLPPAQGTLSSNYQTGGSRSGEQDSKGWFVGTTKIAFWETASVLQLNFIPE